ncbi:hypothetical protein FQR65_LT20559 [Abscondita terminalis]|nr:hypothetical protein FQR65_LT20559 [Abscondita terminalis]
MRSHADDAGRFGRWAPSSWAASTRGGSVDKGRLCRPANWKHSSSKARIHSGQAPSVMVDVDEIGATTPCALRRNRRRDYGDRLAPCNHRGYSLICAGEGSWQMSVRCRNAHAGRIRELKWNHAPHLPGLLYRASGTDNGTLHERRICARISPSSLKGDWETHSRVLARQTAPCPIATRQIQNTEIRQSNQPLRGPNAVTGVAAKLARYCRPTAASRCSLGRPRCDPGGHQAAGDYERGTAGAWPRQVSTWSTTHYTAPGKVGATEAERGLGFYTYTLRHALDAHGSWYALTPTSGGPPVSDSVACAAPQFHTLPIAGLRMRAAPGLAVDQHRVPLRGELADNRPGKPSATTPTRALGDPPSTASSSRAQARSVSAVCPASGLAPYSIRPGRTQSLRHPASPSSAGELHNVSRRPGRDGRAEGPRPVRGCPFAVQLIGARRCVIKHDALDLRSADRRACDGTEAVPPSSQGRCMPLSSFRPHVNGRGLSLGGTADGLQLPRRTTAEPEVMLGHQRHVAGSKMPFQQQDRRRMAAWRSSSASSCSHAENHQPHLQRHGHSATAPWPIGIGLMIARALPPQLSRRAGSCCAGRPASDQRAADA